MSCQKIDWSRYSKLCRELKLGMAHLPKATEQHVRSIARDKIWQNVGATLMFSGLTLILVWVALIVCSGILTQGKTDEVFGYVIGSALILVVLGLIGLSIGSQAISPVRLDEACTMMGYTLEQFAQLGRDIQEAAPESVLAIRASKLLMLERKYPYDPQQPFKEPHPDREQAKWDFENAYILLKDAGFIEDVGYGKFFPKNAA